MKRSIHIRVFLSLMLLVAMMSPTAAFAFGDGKKHFKQGMKHEVAEEWDKASEEFALSVADNPANPEYRLHLVRAMFNASQMYMKKGVLAAGEKDYEGGYLAFRKAYAYDPTNELAKTEMARMVRLQEEVNGTKPGGKKDDPNKLKMVPTGYNAQQNPTATQIPQRLERFRDVVYPGGVDLQFIIKELAKDLDLNVLFDTESFRTAGRKTNIELKNVTAARALDYIFLQEGLFFQKVGPHTVMVASQQQRTKFQQLVLRTFYLANASPKDIAKVVQTAIPAQPGRSQTIVLTDDATNSVTIRDTEENIRLIGQLIRSLDKDRAEVVMDVAIYEVNKTDLLQLGNQIGNSTQLTTLGGSTSGVVGLGGNERFPDLARIGSTLLPTAFGLGLVLPAANLIAFQSKGNTKLIASTQIHAFNNEDSSARIGQRVPVQSAQFVTGSGGNTTGGNGVVSNVINYEQVGLTLKFKPLVFPNQDVQVAMEIESKDVAGAATLTPTFTERTIKGTARIQNNKTLLLASVAQGVQTEGRSGLPLLGLIPILGRLFTAPTKDNRQVDIVIAVTPRVIRAPEILPEDEIERPTGSLAVPTNNSLEAMVIEDEQQDLLAAARRMPTRVEVQLPDQPEAPAYVRNSDATATTAVKNDAVLTQTAAASEQKLKPIDSSVKTLQLKETSDVAQPVGTSPVNMSSSVPTAEIKMAASQSELKAGERTKIAVMITGNSLFNSAVLGLKFDSKKLAVRSVTLGDAFGINAVNTPMTPFLNQNGKTYVSLVAKDGGSNQTSGVLAYIEVEALVDGVPDIAFDQDLINLLTADGKNFAVKFGQ